MYFHNLPQPLQTDALATALGAEIEHEGLSVVCGSPGEVPNDPSLGHQLSFKHGGWDDWHFDSDPWRFKSCLQDITDFIIFYSAMLW